MLLLAYRAEYSYSENQADSDLHSLNMSINSTVFPLLCIFQCVQNNTHHWCNSQTTTIYAHECTKIPSVSTYYTALAQVQTYPSVEKLLATARSGSLTKVT